MILNLRSAIASMTCASFALLGLATPALAQDSSLLSLGGEADTVVEGPTVWLFEDEADAVSGYFLEGEVIMAECDSDCFDIDLALLDESGQVVSADNGLDEIPVVIAPYDGSFAVEVMMLGCSSNQGCSVSFLSENGGFNEEKESSAEEDILEFLF